MYQKNSHIILVVKINFEKFIIIQCDKCIKWVNIQNIMEKQKQEHALQVEGIPEVIHMLWPEE